MDRKMEPGRAIGHLRVLRTLIRAARFGNDDQSVMVAVSRHDVEALNTAIAALEEKKKEGA